MDTQNLDQVTSGAPDISALDSAVRKSITDASLHITQQIRDYETRFCLWKGQSADGRQWDERCGGEGTAFPWDGASDARVPYVDGLIVEQMRVLKAAWRKAAVQVQAIKSDDMEWSGRISVLLNWLFRVHLAEELMREVELFAQWRQCYGLAVMGIWWQQKQRLTIKSVSLDELLAAAAHQAQQEGNNDALDSIEALVDPLQEERALAQIQSMSPLIGKRKARSILNDFRTKGGTDQIPEVEIIESLPCWEALRPFVDVFFPIETSSLKTARWIARRRWLSETQINECVDLEGWDEAWAAEAIKQKGKSVLQNESGIDRVRRRGSTTNSEQDEHRDLVEILHFYQMGLDEKTGKTTLICTVFCPAVPKLFAKSAPLEYDHGEMPFIAGTQERADRPLVESRGIPQIAKDWQTQLKTERDSWRNRASITSIPPLIVPMARGLTRLTFGPGCQHSERRPGELRWMAPPPLASDSKEVQMQTQFEADRYFGRRAENVPPEISAQADEDLAASFLAQLTQAAKQTLQLAQQYLEDVVIERVAGPISKPFQISRGDIQGQFDLLLAFDPRDLDLEVVKLKLTLIQQFVLTIDTVGVIDRASLTRVVMQWIDPNLARQVVGDPADAEKRELDDEDRNIALIQGGYEPPMLPQGQNFPLRLQRLQSFPQRNPPAFGRLQQQPDSAAIYEARLRHLQFMVQQMQNANTGRVGAEPALGAPAPQPQIAPQPQPAK